MNDSAYVIQFDHHGILGQKWGVRRFQDENGKLTNAGKKRKLHAEHKKNQYLAEANKMIKGYEIERKREAEVRDEIEKNGFDSKWFKFWSDDLSEEGFQRENNGLTRKQFFDQILDEQNSQVRRWTRKGELWMEYREELKKMNTSVLSSSDVSREARNLYKYISNKHQEQWRIENEEEAKKKSQNKQP